MGFSSAVRTRAAATVPAMARCSYISAAGMRHRTGFIRRDEGAEAAGTHLGFAQRSAETVPTGKCYVQHRLTEDAAELSHLILSGMQGYSCAATACTWPRMSTELSSVS